MKRLKKSGIFLVSLLVVSILYFRSSFVPSVGASSMSMYDYPQYANAGVNSTIANQGVKFYVYWHDKALSGYKFGWNFSGTFQNLTWTAFSNSPASAWSNVTQRLDARIGIDIVWKVYCNDTNNCWNITSNYIITTANPGYFILRPHSDTSTVQWSIYPTSPTTHYDKVNDSSTGSTYVYATTNGITDLYNLQSIGFPVSSGFFSIKNLTVCVDGNSTTSNNQFEIAIKIGGTTHYSSTISSSTSLTVHSYTWANNPYTNLPWTDSNINSLQVGEYEYSFQSGSNIKVMQVYVKIFLQATFKPVGSASSLIPGQLTTFTSICPYYKGCSEWRFGTNNTGHWINMSWTPFSTNPNNFAWCLTTSITQTLNSTYSARVNFEFWANTTTGIMGNTGLLSIRVLFPLYQNITNFVNQQVAHFYWNCDIQSMYYGYMFGKVSKTALLNAFNALPNTAAGNPSGILYWTVILQNVFTASQMQSQIESAMNNMTMLSNGLPNDDVNLRTPCYCTDCHTDLVGYYYAQLFNYETSKWNATKAYNSAKQAVDSYVCPVLYIYANSTGYALYGVGNSRMYECTQTIETFLMFYQAGVSSSLMEADKWWLWSNNNLWFTSGYGPAHYGYYPASPGWIHDFPDFCMTALELYYYNSSVPYVATRLQTDVEERYLSSLWNSPMWLCNVTGSEVPVYSTYTVVHASPGVPEQRMGSTLSAWGCIMGYMNFFNSTYISDTQNMLQGVATIPPAWNLMFNTTGIVNGTTVDGGLYCNSINNENYYGMFRSSSTGGTWSDNDSTAEACALLMMEGIDPQNATLAISALNTAMDASYWWMDPSIYTMNVAARNITLGIMDPGTVKFLYGYPYVSVNFPSPGIWRVQFGVGWNSTTSITYISALPGRLYIAPCHSLSIQVKNYPMTKNIQGAYVYISPVILTSSNQVTNSLGWSNWTTLAQCSYTLTTKYYGYTVNVTSLFLSTNQIIVLKCSIYDATYKLVENSTPITNAKILVYNASSTVIKYGYTNSSGMVKLTSLPNATMLTKAYNNATTPVQIYSGSNLVNSQNQVITLTIPASNHLNLSEPRTIVVPDNYTKIQWALGNATAGDTVFVKAGTYYEHVVVDKAVSLIGAGESNTIIDGSGTGNVITITANNVNIKGFTIQNSEPSPNAGIYLDHSSNNIVSGNNITNNEYGIWLNSSSSNSISGNKIANSGDGIYLDGSLSNSISGNNITNNAYGIWLGYSSSNSISHNTITASYSVGILLSSSSSNIIIGNNITANNWGIMLWSSSSNIIIGNNITANNIEGIELWSSCSNNIISGNNITNNGGGVSLFYSSSNIISGNNITANKCNGIYLDGSLSNSINGNNIANNNEGIYLDYSCNNNGISGNNIANNNEGIYLDYSCNNNGISGNNITANNLDGIDLESSSNNRFFHNNFNNNTQQVGSYNSTNVWDDGYPSGGNYWSDYQARYPNAAEIDSSGTWNTPYVIDTNNTDNYPLMKPWPIHNIVITNITPSTFEAYPTWTAPLKINVTIMNVGGFNESFPVTLYWNNTNVVGTQTVTLALGETENVTFTWAIPSIPFAYPYPTYTLLANATVPGNINSGFLIGGAVTVKWPGDANGDGHVNGFDLYIMAVSWHQSKGSPRYDPRADFNGDGTVNGFDLYWMAVNWHRGPLD